MSAFLFYRGVVRQGQLHEFVRRVKELHVGLAEVETKLGRPAEAAKWKAMVEASAAGAPTAVK